MKNRIFSLVLMLFMISSCKGKPAEKIVPDKTGGMHPVFRPVVAGVIPEGPVKNMVLRYNELLIAGYSSLNMTQLQEVATEDLAMKAYYHMAAISEGRAKMLSNLKKIDFIKSEQQSPDKFVIRTEEVWDFSYNDIVTGKLLNEMKDYVYHVAYTIENRQGRRVITNIDAIGADDSRKGPSWKELFPRGAGDHAKH